MRAEITKTTEITGHKRRAEGERGVASPSPISSIEGALSDSDNERSRAKGEPQHKYRRLVLEGSHRSEHSLISEATSRSAASVLTPESTAGSGSGSASASTASTRTSNASAPLQTVFSSIFNPLTLYKMAQRPAATSAHPEAAAVAAAAPMTEASVARAAGCAAGAGAPTAALSRGENSRRPTFGASTIAFPFSFSVAAQFTSAPHSSAAAAEKTGATNSSTGETASPGLHKVARSAGPLSASAALSPPRSNHGASACPLSPALGAADAGLDLEAMSLDESRAPQSLLQGLFSPRASVAAPSVAAAAATDLDAAIAATSEEKTSAALAELATIVASGSRP